MQFKCIEMHGFKSFVDQTTINFGDGFTAIVGPNGCGKSNISDAIRWVLGEQRPKTLRGAKMEDFIFSGSSRRKPSGMAEVSITMTDVIGKLTNPGLADYNDVTVTRRLYRSGESEYLINKTPVRLKDVVDLFLDTGISTRAFSIIEQDQVQKIVTSKPEDRRFIVEEAAGIMKYKNRRHQATLKLDGSLANLERVNDIIGELQRQRNSLKRQANKAERYKKYQSEMKQLFIATSAGEYKKLKEMEEQVSRELSRLEEIRASIETDIAARQNQLATLQSDIDEQTAGLNELKQEEFRLGSLVDRNEENIDLFNGQIGEAARQVEKLEAETAELDGRQKSLQTELEDKIAAVDSLQAAVAEKSGEFDRKKTLLQSARAGIEETVAKIADGEREYANTLSELSASGSDLASHRTRTEILDKRLEDNELDLQEALGAFEEITRTKQEQETGLHARQEKYAAIRSELNRLQETGREAEKAKNEKDESIAEQKTEIAKICARLESLKEIEQSREGYQEGTRALMGLKDQGHDIAQLLKGTLVDRIKIAAEYEVGLEMLLGEKLQALLISKPWEAAKAIKLLRDDELGRGTFLPIESAEPVERSVPAKDKDIVGLASELVETDSELRPLMQRLLKDVVFVKNMDAALRLRSQKGFTYVTPQGDIVDRSGIISGGSNGKYGSGLLERKRIIEGLNRALAESEQVLAKSDEEKGRIAAQLIEVQTAIEEKEAALKDEEFALMAGKKDVESMGSDLQRQKDRLDSHRAESQQLKTEKEELHNEITEVEKSIEELNGRKFELGNDLESIRKSYKEAGEYIKTAQDEVSAAEVQLTSLRGEENMASAESRRLTETLVELTERLQTISENIRSNSGRKQELEQEIVRLKEEIHQSLERREAIASQLTGITEKLDRTRAELEERAGQLKEAVGTLDHTRESINQARIKESETAVRLSSLIEKAEEQSVSREEIESYDTGDLNLDEAGGRLAELKSAIVKMGDVNMTAIEEYNQVDERFTFLSAQRDDLVESIEDIKKVIDKLNRTTRAMFEETFTMVRENFRQVFAKLFSGGQADMILTDESNILESGIEIFVQPPGKRRQNINLLSAGEKAMTAISILFSVFMVKPSPFCLLDEVDAPLDETNIVRFKDILREFSSQTQFLVITHNQKTMAFSDRLYGISMQEPGISKVLSVDLVDTDTEITEPLRVVHG